MFQEEDDDDDEEDTVPRVQRRSFDRMESAVDITEKFVFEHLKEPRFLLLQRSCAQCLVSNIGWRS